MAAPPTYAQAQAQIDRVPQPASPPLAPFALFPAFVAQKPETLVTKSKSMWTDSTYTISTADGSPVFTIDKGDGFSFSYRRRVCDAKGHPIFTIKREFRLFQPTIYHALAPSETGARLFECKFDAWSSGDKCTGHFINAISGQPETFFLAGNFLKSKAKVTNQVNGQVMAKIKRLSFKLRTEYHITIQQGMDMALAMALCIIMHDRQESHNSSAGGGGG